MPISIDWGTHVISVPKSYLTLSSGTIYTIDTEQFRLDLKALEETFYGMAHLKTHLHNTTVTIAGVTYARAIQILAPYTVEFEDGQYTVILEGSNNNIFDVQNGILVQNQVQLIPTNSAGLQVVTQGSGVTEQDKLDIADRVWDETVISHSTAGTTGQELQDKTEITDIPSSSSIADAVWDETLSEHVSAGSTGYALDNMSGGSSPTTIAAAVWDKTASGHTTPGSFGDILNTSSTDLKRLLGLMHENIYIDQPGYDSDNNLTSARVRIYSDAGSVGTASNIIGTYTISAPSTAPGKFTSWSQIKI